MAPAVGSITYNRMPAATRQRLYGHLDTEAILARLKQRRDVGAKLYEKQKEVVHQKILAYYDGLADDELPDGDEIDALRASVDAKGFNTYF